MQAVLAKNTHYNIACDEANGNEVPKRKAFHANPLT